MFKLFTQIRSNYLFAKGEVQFCSPAPLTIGEFISCVKRSLTSADIAA